MAFDKLQPRHTRIVEFLTTNAPKRYDANAIAKAVGYAPSTVRNEIVVIMALEPKLQRSMRGKNFKYYIGTPESEVQLPKGFEDWAKPSNQQDIYGVAVGIGSPDYQPAPARLAWKLQFSIAHVAKAALSGHSTNLSEARQALEELVEAAQAYAVNLSRILATTELWDDPAWLTAGLTEENLEKLSQTTRQSLERLAKLDAERNKT